MRVLTVCQSVNLSDYFCQLVDCINNLKELGLGLCFSKDKRLIIQGKHVASFV